MTCESKNRKTKEEERIRENVEYAFLLFYSMENNHRFEYKFSLLTIYICEGEFPNPSRSVDKQSKIDYNLNYKLTCLPNWTSQTLIKHKRMN